MRAAVKTKFLGLLLGYPECCIDYLISGKPTTVSYGGFMPCDRCAQLSLDQISAKLGRSPFEEPPIFVNAFRGKWGFSLKRAQRIYEENGLDEFFSNCLESAGASRTLKARVGKNLERIQAKNNKLTRATSNRNVLV